MSVNDVSQALVNYECYCDGNRYLGTASVTLPEINNMTQDIKGAGILGEMSMPILGHFEDFEVQLTWRTLFERPLKLMKAQSYQMSLRGGMQHYDAAVGRLQIIPVRIDFRGWVKGTNLGKLEPAEQTETETTFAVDYIKITEGDKNVTFEFDRFNYVFTADGTDYLTELREALGL